MRGGEEGSESREAEEEEEGEPSVCGASSDSQQPSHSNEGSSSRTIRVRAPPRACTLPPNLLYTLPLLPHPPPATPTQAPSPPPTKTLYPTPGSRAGTPTHTETVLSAAQTLSGTRTSAHPGNRQHATFL
ncbi:WW domain-binding protein 11-like [Notothenia coriiceps]|uniref:WW domain-binding protein 11-like n=1 Tax=Notothenia coriiceps TaxID=8208 RepID=A0A6I9Q4Z7_9TELE|nr:PREDICTED: WW domain-binding protein 11-like [Notothenia coriiceps]